MIKSLMLTLDQGKYRFTPDGKVSVIEFSCHDRYHAAKRVENLRRIFSETPG